jgi:hypothetical protein
VLPQASPFPSWQVTLRVLVKALILLLILNIVCLATQFDPVAALTRLNLWWLVGHGRERLIYPSDLSNGQLPVESLLSTHTLAYTPKAADEYRVIVLGESGIAGWGLHDPDTFVGQLNAQNLTVEGKRLKAYNLAYPSPNVARDVLILDAALTYKPDLVIWFLTPAGLDDSPEKLGTNIVFFDLKRARLQRISSEHNLSTWYDARIKAPTTLQSVMAIRNQDTIPVWLNTLLYPFTTPDYAIRSRRIGSEPIPAKAQYNSSQAGFKAMPNQTWQFLNVGRDIATQAGADVLFVNEPMLIGTGPNSEINYNMEYERALYDTYHQTLTTYATQNKFAFADLWDVIPKELFTDTPLHADAAGYAALVKTITPYLVQ